MTPDDHPAADPLRAGDDDRERTVATLRRHAGEGRLDAHELDERVDAALRARTAGELALLTRDLPDEPRKRRRRVRGSAASPCCATAATSRCSPCSRCS